MKKINIKTSFRIIRFIAGLLFLFACSDEGNSNNDRNNENFCTSKIYTSQSCSSRHSDYSGFQYEHSLLKVRETVGTTGKTVWEHYRDSPNDLTIAVVDDGVDGDHPDLSGLDVANSYNYVTSCSDPDFEDTFLQKEGLAPAFYGHGTQVAGVIVAKSNGQGTSGLAYKASLRGYALILAAVSNVQEIDAYNRNAADIAVSNNSWGYSDNEPRYYITESYFRNAIDQGISKGFGGKGVSYVMAGGNGRQYEYEGRVHNQDGNMDGRVNYHGVISVCSVNSGNNSSEFSEPGANTWVCAPGEAVHTTDVCGRNYSDNSFPNDHDYTGSFNGTSAAAPVVSGLIGIIRTVYPNLTWRDIKLILAASSEVPINAWDNTRQTGATKKYRLGGGTSYIHSHYYGFGTVDAKSAMEVASSWVTLPEYRTETAQWSRSNTSIAIKDNDLTSIAVNTSGIADIDFIEYVNVELNLTHQDLSDLAITLVSPTGARSLLIPEKIYASNSFRDFNMGLDRVQGLPMRLGSAAHLGEAPGASWTLEIKDKSNGATGEIRNINLIFYGH